MPIYAVSVAVNVFNNAKQQDAGNFKSAFSFWFDSTD
jgi:hypothetical protein